MLRYVVPVLVVVLVVAVVEQRQGETQLPKMKDGWWGKEQTSPTEGL